MEMYEGWSNVPAYLKTKTAISKAGLRRTPKQQVIAQVDTRWKGSGNIYDLYDIRECLSNPHTTPEQQAARAARLHQANIDTHCDRCGQYVKKASKIKNNGLCIKCLSALQHKLVRRHAIQRWAQEMIAQQGIILDTETTGLGEADRLVEIAIVNAHGEPLFHSLVNPEMTMSETVIHVHQITDLMIYDAPPIRDLIPHIQAVLTLPLIIYNANFDAPFLRRAGVTLPGEPECLMLKFAQYYGAWSRYHNAFKWQPLDVACLFFDIPRQTHHRALADAHDAAMVLQAIAHTPPTVGTWKLECDE